MAKKDIAHASAREKAKDMREAQKRRDATIRNSIIAVVVLIIFAVVVAVAFALTTHETKDAAQSSTQAEVGELLGQYADGRPVTYSPKGIGTTDSKIPTLSIYMDYSCHICARFDAGNGEKVAQAARDGKFNIEYHSVKTVAMPYQTAATTASLIVANKDPQHWLAFHHALMTYFDQQYTAGDGTVINDLQGSFKKVKEIAKESGIPENVIGMFVSDAATEYLRRSGDNWHNLEVKGRSDDGVIGTPEFVVNGQEDIEIGTRQTDVTLADQVIDGVAKISGGKPMRPSVTASQSGKGDGGQSIKTK